MGEYTSSCAQYSILYKNSEERSNIQTALKREEIPSMIYYGKPMHMQNAFNNMGNICPVALDVMMDICSRVLSLPLHHYIKLDEIIKITEIISRTAK